MSFDGRSVALAPGQAGRLGLTVTEGSDELRRTGSYVQVQRSALVVHGAGPPVRH